MKTQFVLVFCLMMALGSLCAQTVVPSQIRATNVIDRVIESAGVSTGDLILGIPRPPGETAGDYYYADQWNVSSMTLYESSKEIIGYYVKYDLRNELVEIRTGGGIRVIETYKLRSLVMLDSLTREPHVFINSREYPGETNNELLELLVDGNIGLFKKTQVSVKKSDYVAALDMGSRDEKLTKKESYYLVAQMKLNTIKNKQSLLAALPGKENQVEKYLKENNIRIGKESDLKQVTAFMNSLDTTGKSNP